MRIACWITKATQTHSECVILIAFPLQEWLHEHTCMLRYTYIACLVLCGSQNKQRLFSCTTLTDFIYTAEENYVYCEVRIESKTSSGSFLNHTLLPNGIFWWHVSYVTYENRGHTQMRTGHSHMKPVCLCLVQFFNLLKPSGFFTFHRV